MSRGLGVMVKELLSNLFAKPATVLYPFDRLEPPERFRGRLIWNDELCIRCNMCVRDCPAEVLDLVEREDGALDAKGKPKKDLVAQMYRCIFCGQCEWVCPKDAIRFERVFELAQADKHTLQMYVEHTAPAQEEPAAADEAPAAEEKKSEE
ncbi:MAG TPA: ferredoxin [Armatimonadetes bacterium]|jgi:NAD(P)H-quinone oxidoreductase subunit I|nr:ferredoxin [Armatimonadota bacterium]